MTELTPGAEHDTAKRAEHEAVSGRNVTALDMARVALSDEHPTYLERADLVVGHLDAGGTEIVLQRHGKYIKDKEDPNSGSLTEEAVRLETESAVRYFNELLDALTPEERNETYVLFVASDTGYADGGRRSYETVTIAEEVARTILVEKGVSSANILNISHKLEGQGSPRPMTQLREPQLFGESPDFVKYMRDKYGDLGKEFWIAFEEDVEKETRLSMGAEGPDEIADRMKKAVKILTRYASLFHMEKPNSRLVIWAGTHYDTISPFVKRDVLRKDKAAAVFVDYGGGVTIDIDSNNTAIVNINSEQRALDLENETPSPKSSHTETSIFL